MRETSHRTLLSHSPASPPSHHGHHGAIIAVVALLALYFLAPVILLQPINVAESKGYITTNTANRVGSIVFAPIIWLDAHSELYSNFLSAQSTLCRRLFGTNR